MSAYHVFLCEDGCAEVYVGAAASVRAARHLAARHARGEVAGLPASLYGTARAAGSCAGLAAPPPTAEPERWVGRGGRYAVAGEVTS